MSRLETGVHTWGRRILVRTFAQRLCVVPVRIPRADALDDRRALLQRMTHVTGELDHCPDAVQRVRAGEVPVLQVGLVAVAALER